jgi:hypothetical protein
MFAIPDAKKIAIEEASKFCTRPQDVVFIHINQLFRRDHRARLAQEKRRKFGAGGIARATL